MMQNFSADELTLLLGYREKDKWSTLAEMQRTLDIAGDLDPGIHGIFTGAMKKLSLLTDGEFEGLDWRGAVGK